MRSHGTALEPPARMAQPEAAEISLHYQPITDFRSGEVLAAEALLRDGSGDSSPAAREAEHSPAIFKLDRRILTLACSEAAAWRAEGLEQVAVHVNVSAKELAVDSFPVTLRDVLAETGLPSHALQVEITETSAIEDQQEAGAILDSVKALGAGVWLDDFGTGHSSLSWLKYLRVDGLKLPGNLVAGVDSDPRSTAIVAAVIRLAHELGLRVIAEGVETDEQVEALLRLECDAMQGFYLAKPVPAKQLRAQIGRRRQSADARLGRAQDRG